jgi:hypothetical protein
MNLKLKIEQLPRFEYDFTYPFNRNYRWIMAGEEMIHQVYDINDFYKSLGFTEDIHKKGNLPEEYIWNEYHKDGAKREDACLQAKIVAYLFKNAWGFRTTFENSYKNWIGSCESAKMNDSKYCTACKKHPKNKVIERGGD